MVASEGMRRGAQALEARNTLYSDISHFIQTFKKRVFQQKFRPKYA